MTFLCEDQTEKITSQTTALLDEEQQTWTTVNVGKGNRNLPIDDPVQEKIALANLEATLTGSKWFESNTEIEAEDISEVIEQDVIIRNAVSKRKIGKLPTMTQKEHQNQRRGHNSFNMMQMCNDRVV